MTAEEIPNEIACGFARPASGHFAYRAGCEYCYAVRRAWVDGFRKGSEVQAKAIIDKLNEMYGKETADGPN